ncbi:anti-repressor SinI family protein [Brevibacillus nitrificans]|nr:anti-repressor SinI family protein [Brevibacillus nitrificans]MDR7314350.1 DNA-binding transcriptional MerR regulator [Brevibacillus nitrificans]
MYAQEIGTQERDREWEELILEAKNTGITLDEVREFLLMASPGTLRSI